MARFAAPCVCLGAVETDAQKPAEYRFLCTPQFARRADVYGREPRERRAHVAVQRGRGAGPDLITTIGVSRRLPPAFYVGVEMIALQKYLGRSATDTNSGSLLSSRLALPARKLKEPP
jgi:hypothetical protein